jgi:DNA-binding CsgD family transcriptional regulator
MKPRSCVVDGPKPRLREREGRDQQIKRLTSQELECLRWCKEGKTNWEIGEILTISEKTVEFHLSNSMRKLGAIKDGLISL